MTSDSEKMVELEDKNHWPRYKIQAVFFFTFLGRAKCIALVLERYLLNMDPDHVGCPPSASSNQQWSQRCGFKLHS